MKTKMFALSFYVGALIMCIAHGIYGAGLIRQIPDAPPPVVVPEDPAPPPAPEPPPVVVPEPEPPAPPVVVDWNSRPDVVWLAPSGRSGKGAEVIRGTKAYNGRAGPDGIFFEVANAWDGDWWACVAIERDGKLYVGPYDGIGTKPTRKFKSLGNLTGGGKGGPYIARFGPKSSESASRAYLRLRKGEAFHVFVLETKRNKVGELHRVVMP